MKKGCKNCGQAGHCHKCLHEMKWISVKDQLPEFEVDVLIIDEDKKMAVSCYFSLKGKCYWENRDDSFIHSDITHWMPLPEIPNE